MQVAREAFMKVMNTIVLSVTKRQVEVDGPTEVDGAVQPLIFQATMEVFLYNSTVCRLCGEENDSGTLLYSEEENCQNLSEIINTYLPIKVFDDGQLPRTICPGCTIQLEASVEFLNLIINGQKVIRELHQREKEYKRTVLKNGEQDGVTESIIFEINTDDGVFQMEHPIALQVAGLDRPKRKRGRPPKKLKSAEELALEADLLRSREIEPPQKEGEQDEVSGKRRRKTPTRYKEAVQGKELDRIFKEEGVTEGEDSDEDVKPDVDEAPPPPPREPQVIGHLETSGELVVVVKGKGRGRPKGRMRPTHEQCAICGMEFSCVGRYMSHVAQHGPVQYQCAQCAATFATRLLFNEHQQQSAHAGQHVIAGGAAERPALATDVTKSEEGNKVDVQRDPLLLDTDVEMRSMPDLNPKAEDEFVDSLVNGKAAGPLDVCSSPGADRADKENTQPVTTEIPAAGPKEKVKVKCPHCDKLFSSRQSKSMHIKAVHKGERPYVCLECGAVFPYPRSLALHTLSHRRQRAGSASARRYACDLCGKVLNHPSSVVYHKEAEHAGQRYVCNTCGKCFKHKQLLQRHQLVHSQVRPYSCKTCNASFKTKANLINHQLLHSGVKKFTCEICKHKFAHKTSLTLHMRWHTGSKPYACKICDKSFSQKGNLSEHERIHTGEKPYQCSLCPRRFTTSSQYRLHARRHQPERSYACTHCPKRFASRGGWAAHARRALGAAGAPHKCAHCSRAFSERWALRKHVRSHTGERPFRCAHCPRAFADCSNLNKHTKHVHKQMSLLVKKDTEQQLASMSPRPEPQAAAGADASPAREESVIYVTYDVNDADSAFHILDPEQAASLDNRKMLTTCELYPGPSLLMPQLEHEQLVLEDEQLELQDEQLELQDEQLELQDAQLELQDEQLELQDEQLELQVEQLELQDEKLELQDEQLELEDEHLVSLDESEPIVVDTSEHMAVTDEQGNPLHFTMQDGTRLAITSVDGKSLQVVTQDGQTIPVEINGYSGDEDADEPAEAPAPRPAEPPKGVRARAASPVTHYFTIV